MNQRGNRPGTSASPAEALRKLLKSDDLLICPVVADPLQAKLVRNAGFPCALLGGFGVSAARFGLPDIGLITFPEMLDQIRNTCNAVAGYPIVADGDTGYGNAMNVRRTVVEYARAGAACITIEDQAWPKKCGHYAGGRVVIPREEARMKIRAAVQARESEGIDILILARTDARSGVGMEEAMIRAKVFADEGADILFVEALQTEEELKTFAGAFRVPTWANMMPKTPLASRASLRSMGFKVVTYNVLLQASVRAVQDTLSALAKDDLSSAPPQVTFEELASVLELPDFNEIEQRYAVQS